MTQVVYVIFVILLLSCKTQAGLDLVDDVSPELAKQFIPAYGPQNTPLGVDRADTLNSDKPLLHYFMFLRTDCDVPVGWKLIGTPTYSSSTADGYGIYRRDFRTHNEIDHWFLDNREKVRIEVTSIEEDIFKLRYCLQSPDPDYGPDSITEYMEKEIIVKQERVAGSNG